MSIRDRIRARGAITLAEYMDVALYDPRDGYYASGAQRSGREGDFFTSVDVGPLFGELLAEQFAEMHRLLAGRGHPAFDLVEAAAGNGRLSRDVLEAAEQQHPLMYAASSLSLVDRSPAAHEAQLATLGHHGARVRHRGETLPSPIRGVIFANELLDAMPVHALVARGGRMRELFVEERDGALALGEHPLSTEAAAELDALALPNLDDGFRIEVSPARRRWMAGAADALEAGFLLLIDYGHPAARLYAPTHAGGTLMAYRRHTASDANWLDRPGEVDLTTHVDLTAVQRAAEAAGLSTLGIVDQTYFLAGLDLAGRLQTGDDRAALRRRLAAKTLVMPGGLGSTMKVMVFGKGVGTPALKGLAAGRLT